MAFQVWILQLNFYTGDWTRLTLIRDKRHHLSGELIIGQEFLWSKLGGQHVLREYRGQHHLVLELAALGLIGVTRDLCDSVYFTEIEIWGRFHTRIGKRVLSLCIDNHLLDWS